MLFQWGVTVTDETIRQRCQTFGPDYTRTLCPECPNIRPRTITGRTKRSACALAFAPTSILGTFSGRRHLDNFRLKPGDRFHQVQLGGHDLVDILIDHGNLVEAG